MRILTIATILAFLSPTLSLADDDDLKMSAKLAEKAGEAYERGDFKEAIDLANKAIKLDPKNPAAYFALGYASFSLRQNEEAVKALRELIKINPKLAKVRDRL